jgi:hypothetical protein
MSWMNETYLEGLLDLLARNVRRQRRGRHRHRLRGLAYSRHTAFTTSVVVLVVAKPAKSGSVIRARRVFRTRAQVGVRASIE